MGASGVRTASRLVSAGGSLFWRWVVAVAVGGLVAGVGLILLANQARTLFTAGTVGADVERIELGPLASRSVVYAADGSVLDLLRDEEDRVPVTLDQIPPHVVQAVLDAEDERFFDHGPLDLRSMTRALVNNVSEGEVTEGGSTITQQLVKTELLGSKQNVNRKLQEAALAIRLEEQLPKTQILERYLNVVYFGNGAYGVQAAAERYFQTDVGKLTVGQAVLLAGLIRNPVFADPFNNPEDARARRDVVVDRMVVLGHVPSDEAARIKTEALPTPPPQEPARGSDYFAEYVKQVLLADPRMGADVNERISTVFRGGLRIHTTLDPNYQREAERAVADILPDSDGRFNAALVSVEPGTGAVRALVGGPDFDRTKFNLVTDTLGRQAGSSFKPFTLLAALEAGYIPQDTILGSAPCHVPNPGGVPDPWEPNNVDGQAAGVLTLEQATINSVNCAYARLVKLVGPQKVAELATKMGITKPLQPHLSLTLGSSGVSALDMASAYATLAADGERHTPYVIDRVEDRNGEVIFTNEAKPERAVSVQHARTVNQVLTQVVQQGTGTAARVRGWQVAGKTGSTDNNVDAWFVGYTPKLATAVWMGHPEEQIPMYNVGGVSRVYGGTFPAQIFGAYTTAALAGQEPVGFAPPDRVRNQRAPRFLEMPGERFPNPLTTPVDGDGDGIPTPRPARPSVEDLPEATVPAAPSRPTLPEVTVPTIPEFDDDETPRTARNRDRPRDRTTIPAEE
ncbi:MAG: PBP1A family penicillin-binding protein [Actinomycetota bacterium]|nr:PBP1A family penicillin-binding protein [Actinomycetota bacterium]